MKLIIVDDDEMIVKLLETYFYKHDFQVVGKAYDGRSAMKLVENIEFDGIIVDYYLPDVTGLDVARHALKIRKNIKVVIITASDDVLVDDFPVVRKKVGEFKNLIRHLSS